MKVFFAAFREAAWLNGQRARLYAVGLAIVMAISLCYGWTMLALGHFGAGPAGGAAPHRAGASDFLSFWTAAHMALQGNAGGAYDLQQLNRAEHAAAAMQPGTVLAFFYPPPFLLLCLPFALLPYMAGFFAFVFAQLVALAAVLRPVLPRGWGVLPVLAFPGLLMNAETGQNGGVSAACFGAGMLWLERRPVLAGACLGGLVFKPHLALAVPVALAAARRWPAFFATALSALAWIALSWAVLGTPAWTGFFHALPDVRAALELHAEDWSKLQSVFTSVRWLGAGLPAAYAAQTIVALAALLLLAAECARRPGPRGEVALMAAASLLCSPHLLDYDLAVCAVPLAYIAARADRSGWLPWEKMAAALVFCWPLLARSLTADGVAVGPVILLLLLALTYRRTPTPTGSCNGHGAAG